MKDSEDKNVKLNGIYQLINGNSVTENGNYPRQALGDDMKNFPKDLYVRVTG